MFYNCCNKFYICMVNKKNLFLGTFVVILMSSFLAVKYFRTESAPQIPPIKDLSGKVFNPDELKGKPYIVSYFQTWCKDCIQEQPQLVQLQNHFGKDKLKIIMISDESKEKLDLFVQKFGTDLSYYQTTESLKGSVGIKAYPTTVLYDSKSKVMLQKVEGINWYTPEIVEMVNQALAQ